MNISNKHTSIRDFLKTRANIYHTDTKSPVVKYYTYTQVPGHFLLVIVIARILSKLSLFSVSFITRSSLARPYITYSNTKGTSLSLQCVK